ncbi:Sugar (pentulose and hexulose) kinase [Rubellimicrobium thermophilum DSM 16684]|uniref:Sugar (Pentulose and hexulose) kinase n=1 Tax=Rubellimicrobium thermophilum DSM 16684 TaxID=1123069 RepID=S9S0G5_9RHOB|nr:FGGY family carbohydrate kinase [Rubellimicrobium thermophilum]EPX83715.1 Sugar (pentulose and hexulose) kinase [Rubellimicrobium thermophilum DSM 16684]
MTHCVVALDIGTGSTRAAALSPEGRILRIEAREYDQIVPAHGWSEQRPEEDWWQAARSALSAIAAWAAEEGMHIEAVAACGQMHGTVLVDADGRPTRATVPLWNDKRTLGHVRAFEAREDVTAWLPRTANPPTPPGRPSSCNGCATMTPEAWSRTATVLMPKDYVNLRLTGERAIDWTDAACSFLIDPATGDWSPGIFAALGLDAGRMPAIRRPAEILGAVTAAAAAETGLAAGTPVVVGGADYPVALLGSGVCRPGLASEVAGTSCIVTLVAERPILHPEICNVGTPEGHWGGFVLLEAGGDAARWARRVFHDRALSYADILAMAEGVEPGSEALLFLPYLMGERLGAHRNSRAQFFGLTARHGLPQMHRAVLEGVGFAVNRHLAVMEAATGLRPEVLIASGGGAKADLWLRIKAAIYNRPILIPEEAECGLVGCAILAAVATGAARDPAEAAARMVRHAREIRPDPAWVDRYAQMQPLFDALCEQARQHYDLLDALSPPSPGIGSG